MRRLQPSSQSKVTSLILAAIAPEPNLALATAAEVFPHLDAAQSEIAQPVLEAAQIPATDYVAQDAKWVEVTSAMPDSPSRNSADQNAALTERWVILERDSTWTHPTAGYGTQQRADEARQSWVDYLSWLAGAPTYEYNGAIPDWGWSGYINNFQSWRGWVLNFVPNKYGHLL